MYAMIPRCTFTSMQTPMASPSDKIDLRRERSVHTRKLLIQATLSVIAKKGLAGTTLSTVSEESGLSRSLVGFHFKSKDQMLTEALRDLLQDYRQGWLDINEQADLGPMEKLKAMIAWELGPIACTRKNLAVWFAFWGEISTRSIYRDLVSESDEEYMGILESLLVKLNGNDPAARTISSGLSAMIVGLWMDFHMSPDEFDRQAAIETCISYIRAVLPAR